MVLLPAGTPAPRMHYHPLPCIDAAITGQEVAAKVGLHGLSRRIGYVVYGGDIQGVGENFWAA